MLSHQLKLNRAEERLEFLQLAVKRWQKSDPYPMVKTVDTQTGEHIITIYPEPMPNTWGLDVGDIVHNLRCVLDHLLFTLCEGNCGTLSQSEAASIQSPIMDAVDAANFKRRTKLLNPEAQAAVEKLQPYQAAHSTAWPDDMLGMLRDLSNVDKHRTLHPILAVTGPFTINLGGRARITYMCPVGSTLNHGTVLARIIPEEKMKVETLNTIAECFEIRVVNTGKVEPFDQVLRNILNYIKLTVLPTLEPFI